MICSRKITSFENIFVGSNELCQFAVEVDDPGLVPLIIKNLKYYILGFNLRLENNNSLVVHDRPIKVHSLPKHVKTAQEACDYVDQNIKYDIKDTFAVIAADDRKVAVSVSHLLCDGGFFVDLIDRLLLTEPTPHISSLPLTTEDYFSERLSQITIEEVREHQESMNLLSKVPWSRNHSVLRAAIPGFDELTTKCKYIAAETSVKDLQCFKNKTPGFGLTDSYWTALPLAFMAFDDFTLGNFGVSTCFDFRKDIADKTKINPSNSQNTSEISVIADYKNVKANGRSTLITERSTIREVAQLMRADFNEKSKGSSYYAGYKSFLMESGYAWDNTKPQSMALLSNIGRFDIKRPLVDMWIQQTMPSKPAELCAGLLAYSKNKHGENVAVSRFQQPQTVMNDADAKLLVDMIHYIMKEVPIDTSIDEIFRDLAKKFRKRSTL